MRFAYAGTAPFAELVLTGLAEAGRTPVALVTNPDRPRGRHGTPQPPRIKLLAEELGVPVLQPERLSAPEALEALLAFEPEVFVVCAYGQIVAQSVLDAVETIVVHPSLVPHWRGAAPVERALMAGETELGVCTLRMTAGVDEGPVGDARTVSVPRDADAGEAYELLAPAAVEGVCATLDAIAGGTAAWRPQVGAVTYAEKIGPADKEIDWSRPAAADRRPGARPLAAHRRGRRSWPAGARASGAPGRATGRCPRAAPSGSSWRPARAGSRSSSSSRRAATA